jgi:glycosyltransferase involved in cell wall biosynthesis
MIPNKKYKICLISEYLAGGGAERCAALLSKFFEKKNIEVHHILVLDQIKYKYSGQVLNLGKYKNESNDFINKIKRLIIFKKYLNQHSFNYIIDFRVKNNQFQEFIITKLLFNAPYIVSVHSYMTYLYFPKWSFLAKRIYSNAYGIVTVSNKISNKIFKSLSYTNLDTIYNPIDIEEIEIKHHKNINLDYNYILAIGRMDDDVKQFDKLIMAYKNSCLPSKEIKLVLLGDGLNKFSLENLVKINNLENEVLFLGWQENPYSYMKNAAFTIMSSKNEGFPYVLIESLACGTPVISFDCSSGPSEIITDEHNGLLVEDQNFDKLTLAMNNMIENQKLYLHCKQNARESVNKFSIENIGNQWLEYLKINVS